MLAACGDIHLVDELLQRGVEWPGDGSDTQVLGRAHGALEVDEERGDLGIVQLPVRINYTYFSLNTNYRELSLIFQNVSILTYLS